MPCEEKIFKCLEDGDRGTVLFCDSQVNVTHILGRKEGRQEGREVERKEEGLEVGAYPHIFTEGIPGASLHFPGYWEPL